MIELSRILGLDYVQKVHFLIRMLGKHKVNDEILEGNWSLSCIGVQSGMVLEKGVIDDLIRLGCVKSHTFMDEVLNHESVVLNFLLF